MKKDFEITITRKAKITAQIEGLSVLHGYDKETINEDLSVSIGPHDEYGKKILSEVQIDTKLFTNCGQHGFQHSPKIKEQHIKAIKQYIWNNIGKLTFDEILYFGFRMLQENSTIAYALRVKFPFVFIDAVHFSVREDSRVIKKAAYIVLGINSEGFKNILGIYIGENESSKYWLSVFNDLKNRGVKDILIMCSDNLTGIKEAINAAFPNAVQQRCIVHMIRNSVKYVSYKDLKEFTSDLKLIYTSKNEKEGYEKLQEIKTKWEDKYASAFKIWESNWDAICPFFQFSESIRKIMYTTNTIESLNRQFRKYTKTKSVFPTDTALLKCLYLSVKNIEKKWYIPYRNWGPILSELSIMFDNRI